MINFYWRLIYIFFVFSIEWFPKNLQASLLSQNVINFNNLELKNLFGLISEYNERANKKLNGFHSVPDKAQFFVTSSRPGNFGDHIDFKSTIDNWFD